MIRTRPSRRNINELCTHNTYEQTQPLTPHRTYLSARQISIHQIYKITHTHHLQLLHTTTKYLTTTSSKITI